jgi:hypothetical protein
MPAAKHDANEIVMSPAQHLQYAAKAMTAAAESGRSVVRVLKQMCPHIYQQIKKDRGHPGLLSLWGRCVNVDEVARQVIVHPAILQAIGELAGITMRGKVIHAGLQHTYGYLFSLLDTPYGAKRDRWVSTAMEQGFGIDLSLLGDRPAQGTLLANVTWFLGQIVFRGRPHSLRRLHQNAGAVAPELVAYDFARLPVCRIAEQVVLTSPTGREVMLITDLVHYPRLGPDPLAENTLLAYSVRIGARSPIKLITAFPVRPRVVEDIKASVPASDTVDVRLRYNAYVSGLYGRTVPGRRFFAEPFG